MQVASIGPITSKTARDAWIEGAMSKRGGTIFRVWSKRFGNFLRERMKNRWQIEIDRGRVYVGDAAAERRSGEDTAREHRGSTTVERRAGLARSACARELERGSTTWNASFRRLRIAASATRRASDKTSIWTAQFGKMDEQLAAHSQHRKRQPAAVRFAARGIDKISRQFSA